MKTIANGPEGPSYIIEVRTFWAYMVGCSAFVLLVALWTLHIMGVSFSPAYTPDHEAIYDKSQHITSSE